MVLLLTVRVRLQSTNSPLAGRESDPQALQGLFMCTQYSGTPSAQERDICPSHLIL